MAASPRRPTKVSKTFRLDARLVTALDGAAAVGASRTDVVERALARDLGVDLGPPAKAGDPPRQPEPTEQEIERAAKKLYGRTGLPMATCRRMARRKHGI
jgi:hypothetical protein